VPEAKREIIVAGADNGVQKRERLCLDVQQCWRCAYIAALVFMWRHFKTSVA